MRNGPKKLSGKSRSSKSNHCKRIGIAVHGSQSAHRSLIRGILNYRTEHQCQWEFPFPNKHEPDLDRFVRDLKPADYHGVIGIFRQGEDLKPFHEEGVHCINVLSHFTHPDVVTVSSDDFAIGKMIGEHFIREAIEQVWFYGPRENEEGIGKISRLRLEGLTAACREIGMPSPGVLPFKLVLPVKRKSSPFIPALRELRRNLQALKKKRVGLFLFSDSLINESVTTMVEAGIRIPEEVIVASVDNDSIFCNMAQPSVTSISQDTEKIGYLAAEAMDRRLQGETITADQILVPPLKLNIRKSSDPFETNDPRVQAALSSIRDRRGHRLTVEDLLRAAKVSRRTLEQAFQTTLGCSPYQAIMQSRIDHSKQLLKQSNFTIEAIAIETGFQSLTRFNQAFVKSEGMPPGIWRKGNPLQAPSPPGNIK
jgi:LacI family transcriptional regulator